MTRAARDLVELLDHLEQAAATIRRHGPAILDRAAIPSGRDGYPARASGSQATSAPQVRHECTVVSNDGPDGLFRAVCSGCDFVGPWWPAFESARESATQHEDEHGQPTYSDPTGGAATTGTEPDPVRALAKRTLRDLGHVVRTATAVASALAVEAGKGANLDDPTDWCSHHLAHTQTLEPRFRGDLCRNCYDHKRENGTLPPVEYLRRWANGQRVYKRDGKKGAA